MEAENKGSTRTNVHLNTPTFRAGVFQAQARTPTKFQRFKIAIYKIPAKIKSFFHKCMMPKTSMDERSKFPQTTYNHLPPTGYNEKDGLPSHHQEEEEEKEEFRPVYIGDGELTDNPDYPTPSTDTGAHTSRITTDQSHPTQHSADRMTQSEHPTIKDRLCAIPEYVKRELNKLRQNATAQKPLTGSDSTPPKPSAESEVSNPVVPAAHREVDNNPATIAVDSTWM